MKKDRPQKDRLDKVLVALGLCETRNKAQALVLAGKVKVAGQTVDKPGTLVVPDPEQIAVAEELPYVSRGGLKLAKALDVFSIDPAGKTALDIGASTGGFTDCLLQRGVAKVYAIDVGYGQLDWRLRQDARVVVMEKTNIRELLPDSLPERADLAAVDVSFIGLKKVLPVVAALLKPGGEIIGLIKPQFEHRDYIQDDASFKGVVRKSSDHEAILSGLLPDLAALMPGWQLAGLEFSPVTGPKGNVEFLAHWRQAPDSDTVEPDRAAAIQQVITKSNAFFDQNA